MRKRKAMTYFLLSAILVNNINYAFADSINNDKSAQSKSDNVEVVDIDESYDENNDANVDIEVIDELDGLDESGDSEDNYIDYEWDDGDFSGTDYDDIDFNEDDYIPIDDLITGGDFQSEADYNPADYLLDEGSFSSSDSYDNNYSVYNSESFDFFETSQGSFFTEDDFYEQLGDLDSDFELDGEKEKKKTKKTLQYTINDNSEYKRYIDTGIEVSEDGSVSIDGLSELFAQLAIRNDLTMVEDEDKVMLLLDGRTIIAKEGPNTAEQIIEVFKNTSIDLVVQDSRVGKKFNLVEKLETTKKLPVKVNGEEITLSAKPMIKNSKVMFPIRDISEALGADIEWDKDKKIATITKDEKVIKLEANSDIVNVDGKEYILTEPTSIRPIENKMLSLLNLLVTELEGEMVYDASFGGLIIETNDWVEEDNDW